MGKYLEADEVKQMMKTQLDRTRMHVYQNLDLYIAGTAGLVTGLYLSKKLTKVDEAVVIAEWMDRMARRGHSMFAMSPQEREVWAASVRYISALAKYRKVSVETARIEFIKDMLADTDYYLNK